MAIIKINHVCRQTAEGLEREMNRLIPLINNQFEVALIDTSFDGDMFNAYIKLGEKIARE